MSKVIIVTLQSDNYGNRLQNYALQTIIEKLGYEVDTLTVSEIPVQPKQKAISVIRNLLAALGITKFVKSASKWARIKCCRDFSLKYIHNYQFIPRIKLSDSMFEQYAAVITGSDQVWHNWSKKPEELSYYYLEFVNRSKRIAYAPSFGFTEFPETDIAIHKRGLLDMKSLSCREQEGCKLIKNLTGRNAQKVLDPTLLLNTEEWALIEEKPKFNIPEKYLLQYMLGAIPEVFNEEIQRILKLRKLQLININDVNDCKHYGISPSEFIWLIHHADTVCTDSFHASVFSIIFEKKLRVFERVSPELGNMFGRLRDLLSPLGLMELIYGNDTSMEKGMCTDLDEKARDYLQNERKKSIKFLQENLNNQ